MNFQTIIENGCILFNVRFSLKLEQSFVNKWFIFGKTGVYFSSMFYVFVEKFFLQNRKKQPKIWLDIKVSSTKLQHSLPREWGGGRLDLGNVSSDITLNSNSLSCLYFSISCWASSLACFNLLFFLFRASLTLLTKTK